MNKNIILICNNKDENPDFVLDIKDKFKPEAVKKYKRILSTRHRLPR